MTDADPLCGYFGTPGGWKCNFAQLSPFAFAGVGVGIAIGVSVLGAAWYADRRLFAFLFVRACRRRGIFTTGSSLVGAAPVACAKRKALMLNARVFGCRRHATTPRSANCFSSKANHSSLFAEEQRTNTFCSAMTKS